MIAACVFLYKNFRPLHNDEQKTYNTTIAAIGLLVLLICSPILEVFAFKTQLAEALPVGAGGMIGSFAAQGMSWLLGTSGSLLIILVIMLLALSLLVQASWLDILEKAGGKIEWLWLKLIRKEHKYIKELPDAKTTRRMVREAKNITAEPVEKIDGTSSNRKAVAVSVAPPSAPVQPALFDEKGQAAEPLPTGEYSKPSLALLRQPQGEAPWSTPMCCSKPPSASKPSWPNSASACKWSSATAGPVITRFEIEPAQGVKGSQIVGLAKDLARSMSLQAVRVVETIAGKYAMGIELPNARRQDVMLSEILAANVFTEAKSKLTVALGKDIAGVPVVGDLADAAPLVAGMTGSGKSVGVNGMIMSMLSRPRPKKCALS